MVMVVECIGQSSCSLGFAEFTEELKAVERRSRGPNEIGHPDQNPPLVRRPNSLLFLHL